MAKCHVSISGSRSSCRDAEAQVQVLKSIAIEVYFCPVSGKKILERSAEYTHFYSLRTSSAPSALPDTMSSSTATTTLPLYWHLSSAYKSERLDASAKLIQTLHQFQDNFVAEAGDETIKERLSNIDDGGDDDEVWSAKLDASNAVDVAYAIRRLIRGLASPRDNSRLGFAVALTEVFGLHSEVMTHLLSMHFSSYYL